MKKDTIILIIVFLLFLVGLSLQQDNKAQEPNYCEIYADQEQTASRVAIGGGEREYGLNGSWIKESKLFESCKGDNVKW